MGGSAATGGAGLFAVEICDRAIDRIRALLDLGLDFGLGGTRLGDQFIEPAVELGNHLDELMLRFLGPGLGARHLRTRGVHFREMSELPRQVVEAIMEVCKSLIHHRTIFLDRRQGEALGQFGRMLTGGFGRGLVALLGASRMVGARTGSRALTLLVAGGKVAILGDSRMAAAGIFAASQPQLLIVIRALVAIEVFIVIVVWVILSIGHGVSAPRRHARPNRG